jgi:hypothetical protein
MLCGIHIIDTVAGHSASSAQPFESDDVIHTVLIAFG